MPSRPKSHQLEDRSRSEFRLLLPAEWVVDDIQHDYGLDFRVEIFDRTFSTGQTFYVQLKATSTSTRSIRVPERHLNYWNRMDRPVLLALWQENSEVLFWQWSHHYHPFVRRAMRNPKSIENPPLSETITFAPSDYWHDAAPAEITSELSFLRGLQTGIYRLPLEVGISRADFNPPSVSQFAQTVREVQEAVGGSLHVHQGLRAGRTHVFVGKRHLQIRIGQLQLSFGDYLDANTELGSEVAAVLGAGLCAVGSTVIGADLIDRHADHSRLIAVAGMPFSNLLTLAILRSGRYDIGVRLAVQWSSGQADDLRSSGLAQLTPFLITRWAHLQPDQRTQLVALSGLAAEELLHPLLRVASELRTLGQQADADLLLDALDSEGRSQWSTDPEFLRGAAEAAFTRGRYDDGIDKLLAAVEATDAPSDRLLLAQGFRQAGRYLDGLTPLLGITDPKFAGRARLSAIALLEIVQRIGRRSQTRMTVEADAVVQGVPEDATADAITEAVEMALRFDAASPNTWLLSTGHSLGSPSTPPDPIAAAVLAELVGNDVEWHIIAAVQAIRSQEIGTALVVVEAAVETFGEIICCDALSRLHGPPHLAGIINAVGKLKENGLAVERAGTAPEGDSQGYVFRVSGSETFSLSGLAQVVAQPHRPNDQHS